MAVLFENPYFGDFYASENFKFKIERYLKLLFNNGELIVSSQSLIRKKKSPQARKIIQGKVDIIRNMSKDKYFGCTPKNIQQKICKILCKLKHLSYSTHSRKKLKELMFWALAAIVSILTANVGHVPGLMLGLLWIIKEDLSKEICKCKLEWDCQECHL